MGQQQGKTEIKIHREIITKLRWLPIRGSAFNNTSNSGPSALNLNNPRSNSNDNIGFRSALPLCQEAYGYDRKDSTNRVKGVIFRSCRQEKD